MHDSADRIRILIIDDHPMFRRGVAETIEQHPNLELVAEAGNGREALRLVEKHRPDVVVTDIDMPEMGGLDLAMVLLGQNPESRLAVLTMHHEERLFRKAIDIGVLAYILKDDSVEGIVDGITAAARGRSYVSPTLAALALNRNRRVDRSESEMPALHTLTPTERAILKLVARNRMSKEIAGDLGISPRTVSTHRNNISNKLGLTDKLPLLNWALLHQEEILDLE